MQPYCTMYFVRPAATEENYVTSGQPTTGRWSDSDKPSLVSKKPAEEIGELFKSIRFDACYCSATTRAKETIEEVLKKNEQSADAPIFSTVDLNEMELGKLAGKTVPEQLEYFKRKTGYPHPDAEKIAPKFWAIYQDRETEIKDGNHFLLDKWHPKIDSFDSFYPGALERIQKIAKENLDKVLLISSSGTPMKTPIAHAQGVNVYDVQCPKGSCYSVRIYENGIAELCHQDLWRNVTWIQ